jgi:hypothetical protein
MTPLSSIEQTVLRLSDRIDVLPIFHGSGDMAQEVRERLISKPYDCLAVPLPPAVESLVEESIDRLPAISLVIIPEPTERDQASASFVPIDPCQPVIMGIRVAMGERIVRAYIDREVGIFEPTPWQAPDPFVLKTISLPKLAAAMIPSLTPPQPFSQRADRIAWMAFRLHELELDYRSILCLCHMTDWPWLRQAYQTRQTYRLPDSLPGRPTRFPVEADTLYFVLGELPYLTELYERRRADLRSDRQLAIDGVKELLIETRSRWLRRRKTEAASIRNWVTPQLLQVLLQYVRNHTLLDRRLTPDLYTLVLGAKQMAGDDFAITLLETAKSYVYQGDTGEWGAPAVTVGLGQVELPDGEILQAKNRLQGAPVVWRSLSLNPKPDRQVSRRWSGLWDPTRQCSWPPEDQKIESFTTHVREQATALLGADLARVEKFTTSLKDGIDLRETLRHWHQIKRPSSQSTLTPTRPLRFDLYVKEVPPARGNIEAVIFLFETPADPSQYPWRATWYAEHQEESTLCFYATPFVERMVGPGIGQSRYGGALFLFPPRPIRDIWTDPSLAFAKTLEEKLIAAAAVHSKEPAIALVSPRPPTMRWRQIIKQRGKRLVMIPLWRFSGQVIDRLRRFHVLNGHEIRSYAAHFIR